MYPHPCFVLQGLALCARPIFWASWVLGMLHRCLLKMHRLLVARCVVEEWLVVDALMPDEERHIRAYVIPGTECIVDGVNEFEVYSPVVGAPTALRVTDYIACRVAPPAPWCPTGAPAAEPSCPSALVFPLGAPPTPKRLPAFMMCRPAAFLFPLCPPRRLRPCTANAPSCHRRPPALVFS